MHELMRNVALVGGVGTFLLILNALLHYLTGGRRPRRGPRVGRLLALLGAVVVAGSSCVSVRALPQERVAAAPGGGSVEVRIFETLHARRLHALTVRTIVSELWRRQNHEWVLVREAREPGWTVSDLPAGKYQVRVGRWIGDSGVEGPLGSRDHATFKLAVGERVGVDVVLRHPGRPLTAVAVTLFSVGVTYAILHAAMSSLTFDLGAF